MMEHHHDHRRVAINELDVLAGLRLSINPSSKTLLLLAKVFSKSGIQNLFLKGSRKNSGNFKQLTGSQFVGIIREV